MLKRNEYELIMRLNKLLIKNVEFEGVKDESSLLIKLFEQENNKNKI
jgi:hypothetical protein